VEGEPLIRGMLHLALELEWWKMDPQVASLAAPLVRRLAEAADAGAFSSANSPLAGLASTLACKLLSATCESCPPVAAEAAILLFAGLGGVRLDIYNARIDADHRATEPRGGCSFHNAGIICCPVWDKTASRLLLVGR
jgi:hypothetical protein